MISFCSSSSIASRPTEEVRRTGAALMTAVAIAGTVKWSERASESAELSL